MCYEKPEKEGAEMRQGVVIGRAAREIEVALTAETGAQEVKVWEEAPVARSWEIAGTAMSRGIVRPSAQSQSERKEPERAARG